MPEGTPVWATDTFPVADEHVRGLLEQLLIAIEALTVTLERVLTRGADR